MPPTFPLVLAVFFPHPHNIVCFLFPDRSLELYNRFFSPHLVEYFLLAFFPVARAVANVSNWFFSQLE